MVALAHRRRLLEGELDASSSRSKGLLGGVIEVVDRQAAAVDEVKGFAEQSTWSRAGQQEMG